MLKPGLTSFRNDFVSGNYLAAIQLKGFRKKAKVIFASFIYPRGWFHLVRKEKALALAAPFLFTFQYSVASECPDLSGFYDRGDEEISSLEAELSSLSDQCADSAEFFALLGATQIRIGDLLQANESLELALLLDPQNGSALFDYAELLNQQGQTLNAIELIEQLLTREDLPLALEELIIERLGFWRRLTTDQILGLGISLGYDSNLNSAPTDDSLALTLSGRSVVLDVAPEFQATSGGYSRLEANGLRRTGSSDFVSTIYGGVSGKFSDLSSNELLQASTRFSFAEAGDLPRWNIELGLDYLNYGGNSIYGSPTVRGSYVIGRVRGCGIMSTAALQYQHFYMPRILSGFEGSLGMATVCEIPGGSGNERFGLEVGVIHNRARYEDRLGQDRDGWRINMVWQQNLGGGTASLQYTHSELDDEAGYSPLFDNGVKRSESLNSLNFRYIYALDSFIANANFVARVAYYDQHSSVSLFRTRGTVAEITLNWAF